jgi:DNA-3-methyladenine glycosylase
MRKLPRKFYDRDTIEVAHELLGKCLVHVSGGIQRVGRIVEAEAYLGPHDLAAHSSKGLTPRTKTMFGPPGHAYVYLIYGMYHCMNVVTQPEGTASAVLLRALDIDRRLDGHDLLSDDFYIADDGYPRKFSIVKRPRIGVDYAGGHWARRLLRFYIRGNAHISKR